MEQKIKRIKKLKKRDVVNTEKYRIRYNANEEDNSLDISIFCKEKNIVTVDSNGTPTGLTPGVEFHAQTNNAGIQKIIFDPEDLVRTDTEAILQFSIGTADFLPDLNVITLYETVPDAPPPADSLRLRVLGKLEFFVEVDDTMVNVRLNVPGLKKTSDEILFDAIDKNTVKFQEYRNFIDKILCKDDKPPSGFDRNNSKQRSPFIKSEEYNLLKFATEFFMLKKFGVDDSELKGYIGSSRMLPYYEIVAGRIRDDLNLIPSGDSFLPPEKPDEDCEQRTFDRLYNIFMVELIWNYWMEQGMLVQTLNVINLRFQNIKGSSVQDRLQRFNVDPLRPLSHILWGYIQDEQHRLSLPRRLTEYDHEYGLVLTGRAVPALSPIDSRVKFLEAFHNLLNLAVFYYHEADDTTRIADAFPILNSLKEVHLLLAEGNHNAYGNLTWTARQEMLMQQYILSRTEMREFLGGRIMVPYPEDWMDRVDTMRDVQGWGSTSIVHYYELAVHGELILLSIRYGSWSDVKLDRNNAANWAHKFRNSIQRYVHAYRVVTGIDLSADQIQLNNGFALQPAYLIHQRLLAERTRNRRA